MSSQLPINSQVEVVVRNNTGDVYFDMVVTEFEIGRQVQPVTSDVYSVGALASQR